jgi:hypothetical protein
MISHQLVVLIGHDSAELFFWYFLLTIQNTTTPQVRNLFSVIAVFISFCPWRTLESAIPGRKAGGHAFLLLASKKINKIKERKRKREKNNNNNKI